MLPFALVDRQTSKQTNKRCCKYRMDVRTPDLEIEQTAEIVVEVDMMLVADELEDADLLAIVANACHTRINTEELLSISCHHSVILLTKKHREGWATKTQERPPSCDTGFCCAAEDCGNSDLKQMSNTAMLVRRWRLKHMCRVAFAHTRLIRRSLCAPDCLVSSVRNVRSLGDNCV